MGQSPLHYEDGYYHEFNKALNFVLKNNRSYYSQKEQFNIEKISRNNFEILIDNNYLTAVYVYKNKDIIEKKSYSRCKKLRINNLDPGKYRFKFFVKNQTKISTYLSKFYTVSADKTEQ